MVTSSPVLWKKITAQNEIPSNILCKWIENSPLLKEVYLRERTDINTVAERLSKYCKNLQSLKIENCKGNDNSSLVKSKNLCHLLTRCKYLNNLYFSGIKIRSCKFFKLLSKRKHFGITKKCSYYGPVSQKQMRVLIESIVNSETYDAATLFTANNRQISINELFSVENNNHVDVPATVDHIWEDIINNNIDDEDEDFDEFDDLGDSETPENVSLTQPSTSAVTRLAASSAVPNIERLFEYSENDSPSDEIIDGIQPEAVTHAPQTRLAVAKEEKICQQAFLSLHGLGKSRLERLQKYLACQNSTPPVDRRGRHETEPNKIPGDIIAQIRDTF
ncbi:hypothetical protein NQ314_008874 [Rhamnusium bicolor]|uniref:Uncharacterized protein n=1 Tax=Rhamnusium bicolor TaxID=1586634 RepID=A0AAV8Y6A2_9CUCU|nr:hypothetical protein NQ314_008874 [Rhamnusium bicolor]